MSAVKYLLGTRTNLTTSAFNSLAQNTYVSAGVITINSALNKTPLDVLLEVTVVPQNVFWNKQALVFIKESLDGTNFTSGPESGTTSTDEPNLVFVGAIPCNSNSTTQRGIFSLATACSGVLPHSARVIVKNETGNVLNASGGNVFYSFVDGDVV